MTLGLRKKRPRMKAVGNGLVMISPPEDLHFTAAKRALDTKRGGGVGYLASTFFLVGLQLSTAWCLFSTMGNKFGVCSTASDCGPAHWCTITTHPKTSAGGMCIGCGFTDAFRRDLAPRFCDANGNALGDAAALQQAVEESDFEMFSSLPIHMTLSASDVVAMCAACVDARGFVAPLVMMNIQAIGLREGTMFVLVAIASSLCIMEEALSLFKTLLFIHRAVPPESTAELAQWARSRRALLLLQSFRIFMLASVLTCVPLFVLFDSADGVSILLNTVAALFILELDNFAFAYGVREIRRDEILEPFSCSPSDATSIERAKEGVALAALVGIFLVGLGPTWKGSYLILPWGFVILACTVGEAMIVCREAPGGRSPGASERCAALGSGLVRLATMVILTALYPLFFAGGTWWIGA